MSTKGESHQCDTKSVRYSRTVGIICVCVYIE